MKFKVSTKDVKKAFSKIYSAGYCSMYYLLMPFDSVAYTAGIYGWNYDVFEPFPDGVAICTGYRNMPGKRLKNVDKYEGEACKVWNNLEISHESKASQIKALLKQLLDENGA